MRFLKPTAAALAIAVGVLSLSATAAEARHRHRHGGDAVAAGILGFAAGAFVSSLAQPRYYDYGPSYDYGYYDYYQPAPVYRAAPPLVYSAAPGYGLEPWSPEWYSYCNQRYRSFDDRTGYFRGYDGQYHFCQ